MSEVSSFPEEDLHQPMQAARVLRLEVERAQPDRQPRLTPFAEKARQFLIEDVRAAHERRAKEHEAEIAVGDGFLDSVLPVFAGPDVLVDPEMEGVRRARELLLQKRQQLVRKRFVLVAV